MKKKMNIKIVILSVITVTEIGAIGGFLLELGYNFVHPFNKPTIG